MPSLPILRPREIIKAFEKLGWEIARQKGSHIILIKEGHVSTLTAKVLRIMFSGRSLLSV